MSLESNDKQSKKNERTGTTTAALIGGVIGSAVVGAHSGYEEAKVNSNFLSPAAIVDLQKKSGATEKEIASLESRLKDFMIQELKRLRTESN
jgi:hypothetical protein